MRRISLALALVGAVAAAGCSGGAKSSTDAGDNQGVAGQTFTVKVDVWKGGSVKSQTGTKQADGTYVWADDSKIVCSAASAAALCFADYPVNTAVQLISTTPNSGTIYFNGFAGDCQGYVCNLVGNNSDKAVIAMFTAGPESHPNWINGHDSLATAGLACDKCHGSNLQGLGIAPACSFCHDGTKQPIVAKGENCANCHANAAGMVFPGSAHQKVSDARLDPNTVLKAEVVSVVSGPYVPAAYAAATTYAKDAFVTYNSATYKSLQAANTGNTPDAVGSTWWVAATPTTFDSTLTFKLTKQDAAGVDKPYSAVINDLAQKTMYATRYDGNRQFNTTFSFSATAAKESTTKGTYTVKATNVKFKPETSDSFILVYFAETAQVIPQKGNYRYYDNLAIAGKTYDDGTAWTWGSAVKSDNCSKCHPSPYLKHGYRPGPVTGLEDMVACKVCHYDTRTGSHAAWTLLATDPAAYAAQNGATTPEQNTAYAYVASTMNDTHMSHAMEFAYPQSMANCVTCHEGKLDVTFADANFKMQTCKSCHPVTATTASKGAPPLYPMVGTAPAAGFKQGVMPGYHTLGADGLTVSGHVCNFCHSDASSFDEATHTWSDTGGAIDGKGPAAFGGFVPLLAELHNGGYDARVYANATKLSSIVTTTIGAAAFDSATNILTVPFTVTSTDAAFDVTKSDPLLVISLYGFDTKDFVVSGHGTHADTKRNLETNVKATTAHPRITFVADSANSSASATWTATVNLTTWASRIGVDIKRAEIGVLPKLLENPADTTTPALAIGGVSKTFDLVGNAVLADAVAYGRNIVSTAKCNACHEALAIEFHNASYGSAGVVGCRLCHNVPSGGSHLEMQSRSIDSYVHAIHSMQPFDAQSIDWADPVAELFYEHHIESTYPKFTTLDCESCHNPGTYDVPNQTRSLPSVLSASSALKPGYDPTVRTQFTVPSVVTGPAARACGSCHRSEFIKEGDAAGLGEFDAHTQAWGYRNPGTSFDATNAWLDCLGVVDGVPVADPSTCVKP